MTDTAKKTAAQGLQRLESRWRAMGNRWKKWRHSRRYGQLSVRETFAHIYRSQAWGSLPDRPFCSGDGSIREEAIEPYIGLVRRFIEERALKSVVDLGCGDFGVGSRLIRPGLRYTGVDVVPDLIRYNHEHFASDQVEFRCLDMIVDDLPPGDLCLVRQVLQHLSNDQILKTLISLTRYRYILATEHVYTGPGLRRNEDKPHGPGTRLPKRSGVFLEAPPFHCPATLILEVPLAEMESLRTLLIEFA
jgi:2-polyprenyl-3-methyl-5-hydroxy-6-metoxy-1,4-benzoquinol methylase